ncbi:Hypothetical protein NCDO2118_1815 [Lactococcus lactis subsp. lactis NCDO 2118]|uniref:Major facilitator superfamily (MFS) profile domain-containing protein n=1 Tax=Lactococcus lactis subsp. lactis NCDO 2118 TaxID=1117941 RepID=A0ABC8A7D6_LACLL|nr:MFS transporter [Lactococcus lactis]ADA65452.1 Multidrug-efflux protein, MF superfamily [Lactococcus lactis subsp. lactis KF147]AII13270.1 Hypothetical protein NCDO2118_1815 [Lactococcus lactis subsp. lactis NCDO 2118]
MYKKMSLFLGINLLVSFAGTLFQMNILWRIFTNHEQLQTIVLVLSSSFILQSIFSLVAGVIADSYPKKRLLLISIVSFILVVIGVYFIKFDSARIIFYLIFSAISTLFQRGIITLVASALSTNEYIKYDSISVLSTQVTAVLNNILAGLIITFLGLNYIYLLVFLLFILSLFVTYFFIPNEKKQEIKKKENTFPLSFIKEKILSDKKIIIFMILLFFLNLDYGYIPNVLPFFMLQSTKSLSPLFLSLLKSSTNIGESLASIVIIRFSKKVSQMTKIGLLGSAFCFIFLPMINKFIFVTFLVLLFYGFFDTFTQPLFSYFVSSIDSSVRGRIIGVIDCVVYIAAPIGMILGNTVSHFGLIPLGVAIATVFLLTYLILVQSKIYRNIDLEANNESK